MNFFDSSIINFFHNFSNSFQGFTALMMLIADNYLVKGGIVVSLFWYLWFTNEDSKIKRELIIIGFVSCLIAILVGRILARILPFRARPLLNPEVNFLYPNATVLHGLDMASSFPSDHSVMFFSLATAVFLISKRLGILTYCYIFLFICVPRVYLGLHYPTDILAGAVIGILIPVTFSIIPLSHLFAKKILTFNENRRAIFFLLLFLLSFEIGTMFESTRAIGHFILSNVFHFY